jgi:hypothetical protein
VAISNIGSLIAIAVAAAQLIGGAAAFADCEPYEDETQTTYRQLHWADFHGARPEDPSKDRFKPAKISYISTSIQMNWSRVAVQPEGQEWAAKLVGVCVQALMHNDRSGLKHRARTVRRLAHEQGHFDITHYFAESLGSRLERLEYRAASRSKASRGLPESIEAEFARSVDRWKQMQAHYDRETMRRRSHWAQRRWLEKIDALLATTRRELGPTVAQAP